MKQNEPEIYARISKILLPKDYIRYRLTGSLATEVSDASGTLLFNVRERKWSGEMLACAGDTPQSWMPDCFESTVVSGHVQRRCGRDDRPVGGHAGRGRRRRPGGGGRGQRHCQAQALRHACSAPAVSFSGTAIRLSTIHRPGCIHFATPFPASGI